MTNQDIIRKVQDLFDALTLTIDSSSLLNSNNSNSAVAIRMINAYCRFISCRTSENQLEFECSLRNYLLFLKTDIIIKDYALSEPNRFGLMMNHFKGSIYANFDLPQYVNGTFVRTVFDGQLLQEAVDDNEIKGVNPYIYKLTNQKFKTFKSIEQQIPVM